MSQILYNYFAENKINVCFIKDNNFYCLIQENEGVFQPTLVGYITDIEKKGIINNISGHPDIPDFFKDYILQKIRDVKEKIDF